MMKPPPVTQQPPSAGETQSSAAPSSTHAPQADAWVPAPHVGVVSHAVSPVCMSFVHVIGASPGLDGVDGADAVPAQ
jgi:hypothetical protein